MHMVPPVGDGLPPLGMPPPPPMLPADPFSVGEPESIPGHTSGRHVDASRVEKLRRRLARRREFLALLRKRIDAARRGNVTEGRPLSTVDDISRRFMNAAAEAEARVNETRSFAGLPGSSGGQAGRGGGGVSALASKWNKGLVAEEDAKAKEAAAATQRPTVERMGTRAGNVRDTSSMFNKEDSKLTDDLYRAALASRRRSSATATTVVYRGDEHESVGNKENGDYGSRRGQPSGADFVELEEGVVPQWAVQQDKRMIRKEKARSASIDMRQARAAFDKRDGEAEVDVSHVREASIPKGNVRNVLAMWHQKSEEQLLREKEEALREETMLKLRESMESRPSISRASSTASGSANGSASRESPEVSVEMLEANGSADVEHHESSEVGSLDYEDDDTEPTDVRELCVYLERKIEAVEREIKAAEEELDELDRLAQ